MKKFLAILLGLTMVLALTPLASAAGGVVIPVEPEPAKPADPIYPYYYYYDYAYVVTASALNYRSAPSSEGAVLGSLRNGSIVTVTGFSSNGKWASTVVNGSTVWMYLQYLAPVDGAYGYYGYDYYPYYYGYSYYGFIPTDYDYYYYSPYYGYYNPYYNVAVNTTYTVASYPYALLYAGPGSGYAIVGSLATGSTPYVYDIVNGFGAIVYDGVTAYVPMVDLK